MKQYLLIGVSGKSYFYEADPKTAGIELGKKRSVVCTDESGKPVVLNTDKIECLYL